MDIGGSTATDLSPLGTVATLTNLYLDGSAASNPGPLAAFNGLVSLRIADSPLNDLGPLASVTSLESLAVDRTKVRDLSPITSNGNLSSLGGIIQVEMQEQRVSAGEVTAGATVPNPLRGFGGEIIAPTAESLATAGATLSLDAANIIFSTWVRTH